MRSTFFLSVVATALATPLLAAGTDVPYESKTDRYIAKTPDTSAMIAPELTTIDPIAWQFRTDKEFREFTAAVSKDLRIKDAADWQ